MTFIDILFGFAGISMIFWVSLIALWHADMIPTLFSEDYLDNPYFCDQENKLNLEVEESGLINRGKYTRRAFVIADFNPPEDGYSNNRLYTLMLLSLGIMTFLIIAYAFGDIYSLLGLADISQ